MTVAMQVVQIIFQTVGIFFMLTLMFIGIWSFVIFLKMYKTQRLQNYLLEKINHSISSLEFSHKNSEVHNTETAFGFEDNTYEDDNRNVIRIDEA